MVQARLRQQDAVGRRAPRQLAHSEHADPGGALPEEERSHLERQPGVGVALGLSDIRDTADSIEILRHIERRHLCVLRRGAHWPVQVPAPLHRTGKRVILQFGSVKPQHPFGIRFVLVAWICNISIVSV